MEPQGYQSRDFIKKNDPVANTSLHPRGPAAGAKPPNIYIYIYVGMRAYTHISTYGVYMCMCFIYI